MSEAVKRLIDEARAGDRDAFEALVRRYLPSVHEIVRQTSKGRGVPGDLVREAFHRAWGGLAGLSPRQEFGPWLGGIARYVCREAARRRAPFTVAGSRGDHEDVTRDRTFRRLGDLPAEERDALLLRHLDRMSRADAARSVGASLDEFDRRLRSARERLRGELPDEPEGAE